MLNGPILDYGVGWGRLSRLLLKYVDVDHIHGVDSWQRSLELAHSCRISHRLDQVSTRLAPNDLKANHYAAIYSFSVFTHLAPEAFMHNLMALSAATRPGGRLVVTARPAEFWSMPGYAHLDDARVAITREQGIVHIPAVDAIDYGDTAVSSEWMFDAMSACGLAEVDIEWNHADAYQVIWSARKSGRAPSCRRLVLR